MDNNQRVETTVVARENEHERNSSTPIKPIEMVYFEPESRPLEMEGDLRGLLNLRAQVGTLWELTFLF